MTSRESVYDDLEFIWIDTPAYMIDWLRENKDKIKQHIIDCNKFIDDLIDIIK